MGTLLDWASQYSAPVLVLASLGAALIFVLKLVTERAVAAQFDRHAKELELKLERRSEFEEQALLDRYKLVCEFAQRLARITTDLNRVSHGQEVEDLYSGSELVPLTAVYEDLSARRFQLSEAFHQFFTRQANVVMALANAGKGGRRREVEGQYLRNLDELTRLVNEEFGTHRVSW